MNENDLRTATRWLYRNRHTGYWTYLILLSDNVDASVKKLNLSADDASMVFEVLADLEFLKPIHGQFLDVNGSPVQKYRVNYAKLEQYHDFANPPCYQRLLSDYLLYRIRRLETFIIVIATVLLTALAQSWISSWFSSGSAQPPASEMDATK